MASRDYVPDRGDIVWLQFNPQSGHEQTGRRPALVLSPQNYNRKVGLALLCPISSQVKGYPFEVLLPENLQIQGAVLSDQVKSLDWRSRDVRQICAAPASIIAQVCAKLSALVLSS
ncbi:MAG TPA: endoribonuclease MazF [Methylococcaceae bacterium]|nr:endoribonuclease MazF [Methylococcaceae bacterium]